MIKRVLSLSFVLLLYSIILPAAKPDKPWKGKRIAVLGDSMSDPAHIGTTKCYYEFLEELMEVKSTSYAKNGAQTNFLLDEAKQAYEDQQKNGFIYDLILIWGGTNDFRGAVPLGEWYTYDYLQTNSNGKTVTLKHRTPYMTMNSFRGRLNFLLQYLKNHFPDTQIVIMTLTHRAFAQFDDNNIQPEESFANSLGLFIDDYVKAIKESANVWAIDIIDLNAKSGLFPLDNAYSKYFHNEKTDKLHPGTLGHYRIAKVIEAALQNIATDIILEK
ncbi:SGNH/GDSL hydrolase family protein [Phocaeicola oris]|uniref:SGNH/GDSL hydrolase family protein n=1 Tax=Phocaeicola oris TaxID=2896850 RepID=UPI00234F7C3D|nr:SGNH/GDSL hydrolase family protein [Phocaeicola oris]MCE2617659.1 SGNH/GDSL hydrolase family protein [Phocaeicola oris]